MAEAMVPRGVSLENKEKVAQRAKPTDKASGGSTEDRPKTVKQKQTVLSAGVASKTATKSVTIPSTQTGFNKEALLILREMNSNVNKTNETVAELSKRVDALYEDEEWYEDSEANCQYVEDDIFDEAPNSPLHTGQKRVSVIEDNVFASYAKKFRKTDATDIPINTNLAELVNSSYREGMADENYAEISKSIHRPENCEALVETRVNPGVWTVLRPQTQTEDSKLRSIQNCIVKAGCCIAKLMDRHADSYGEDETSLELGMNAIGLLGNANKWINIRRKEQHKKDMDPRLHHLCSASQTYTDMLYGDSIVKDIKDIQEINKISRNVSYSRGRSIRGRGRMRSRGRGLRGRGYRMAPGPSFFPAKPKNSKMEAAKKQ